MEPSFEKTEMINITIHYSDTEKGYEREKAVREKNTELMLTIPDRVILVCEDSRIFPDKNPSLGVWFSNYDHPSIIFGTSIDLQTAISLRNGLNQFIHEAEIAEQREYEKSVRNGDHD